MKERYYLFRAQHGSDRYEVVLTRQSGNGELCPISFEMSADAEAWATDKARRDHAKYHVVRGTISMECM